MENKKETVQTILDSDTVEMLDRVAAKMGLGRSAIVRMAVKEWLHSHAETGTVKEKEQ